jgi:hypothetical protein
LAPGAAAGAGSAAPPFKNAVMEAGTLRHSNIVRQLLAGVPTRVVAVNHDTSVAMIEKTYSRYIGDHSDAVARRALLDTTVPPPAKRCAYRDSEIAPR